MAGRRAVVTGGASGIGLATATLFADEGAQVAILDRDRAALDAVANRPGLFAAAEVDVTDSAGTAETLAALAQRLDGIDCLVSCAAARAYGTVAEATDEDWAQTWQVNVAGTVTACRSALPFLRRSAGSSIVIVSSVYGIVGRAGMAAYDATKAALVSLTRSLAAEEAAHSVRVNAVCPGSTWTPWTARRAASAAGDSTTRAGAGKALLDRWADPQEIAFPILWLASAEASYVTGQALVVDGGLSAV